MDYTTEVVNITKIKDGFFLGDEATASNLDVIIQFKITHMVNAAGSQILNAWESIGIKYLTLNWSENSNQNLFDQKDEIANRIVNFIDDSFKNGEGILVHSLRGQNRACLVILLYFIKKFRWTLAKSLEFLTNKKFDVEIPKHFLNQLSFFESRLCKVGLGPKSSSWQENANDHDPEEVLIKNTYLNGLPQKVEKLEPKNFPPSKRIQWADNNINNKSLLCNTNLGRELILQKDIKPILTHKKLKPNKSSLKKSYSSNNLSNLSGIGSYNSENNFSNNHSNYNYNPSGNSLLEIKKSSSFTNPNTGDKKYIGTNVNLSDNNFKPISVNTSSNANELLKNYTNLGNIYNTQTSNEFVMDIGKLKPNPKNFINSNVKENNPVNIPNSYIVNNPSQSINVSSSLSQLNNNTSKTQSTHNNNRHNNFASNQQTNNPQVRSYSSDNKNNHNSNTGLTSNVGNNLQLSNQLDNPSGETKIIIASKYKNVVHNSYNNIYIQNPEDLEKIYNNNLNNQMNNNSGHNYIELPTTQIGSSYNNYLNKNNNTSNSGNNVSNTNKLIKSVENQRMLQNNFLNPTTNNNILSGNNLIDYNKLKVIDYTSQNKNQSYKDYNQTYNQTTKPKTNTQSSSSNTPSTLNNYQPELNKKNNLGGSLNSSTSIGLLSRQNQKQAPIKIQSEYDRKISTPDNTYNPNNISTVKLNSGTNKNIATPSSLNNYGTIKRPASKQKSEERPSTAPQKENEKQQMTNNSSLKRLPSPNLKSNMGSSAKNIGLPGNLGVTPISYTKYRSPSPSTIGKQSTLTIGSIKSSSGKPKWK